jgi:hypothetical protein
MISTSESSAEDFDLQFEGLIQLIKRYAIHLPCPDLNLFAPPPEPGILRIVHVMPSSDHQQANVLDGIGLELGFVLGGTLLVFQYAEPVQDLAEPVVEPWRPLRRRFARLFREDTLRGSVFKFHEAEIVAGRIPDDQVARVVAEEVEFTGKSIKPVNPGVIRPDHRGQMPMGLEEWQDVGTLAQVGLSVEELLEFDQFLLALARLRENLSSDFIS